VCKGHLLWISEQAKKSNCGLFVANYWVTGDIIDNKSPIWRPNDSLTDNPFQIIKAKNHADVFPEDRNRASAAIRSVYINWLSSLENQDKRSSFAWPHVKQSDTNVFRLDDHVWIWKALKAINDLGLWMDASYDQVVPENVPIEDASIRKEIRRLARLFGHKNAQREILRRFTTVNDVSRKRALATTRSPRETRFLFHARDTVLFYEYDEFLSSETLFAQVWANTIDAQKYHDENQETRWDNTLRFALAIVMGTDYHVINKDKSPKRLIDESLSVLLNSSSQNGLFAGQLDETIGEPVLFYREEHRDWYFHTTFEIPFILLSRASKIFQSYNPSNDNMYDKTSDERSPDGGAEIADILVAQAKFLHTSNQPASADRGQTIAQITQAAHNAQEMKKRIPLNRFVDTNSTIDYAEEWLYNYPPFLSANKAPSFEELRDQVARYVVEGRAQRAIEESILNNPVLAEELMIVDEECRNRVINILVNYLPASCVDLFQVKENREPLQTFANSLDQKVEPAVRAFLDTGIVSELFEEPKGDNGTSPASPAPTRGQREAIINFFQEDEIVDKLETFLYEHLDILVAAVREIRFIRIVVGTIAVGSNSMIHVVLKSRTFYEKVRELIEEDKVHQKDITLQAAVAYLGRVYDPEESQGADGQEWYFDNTRSSVTVQDTEKKRTQGKRRKISSEPDEEPMTNLALWTQVLHPPRTAEKAKKRYIFLWQADPETALLCVLGSPAIERPSMSAFFGRHANYEMYFFDDTTMSLNTWETEFHLTFFRLASEGDSSPVDYGIPETQNGTLPDGSRICKASMGFRFFGDYFDRYWTCHFIQFIPSYNSGRGWDYSNQRKSENRARKQRKVLELILFDSILDTMVSSTRDIFEKIKENLGVPHGALSFVDLKTEDYFSSSDHWQKSQHALQAIEDHLAHVAIYIGKWETREKDRGLERPRWTRSDESKYRGDLKKFLVSNNSKVKDLTSLQDEIKTLKVYLMSRQDQIRNDLSLRGSENIRFFTYVTVIFLPLGFAVSCFSMNDTPSGLLIGNMAATAAVSLVLTTLALVNAETLGNVYNGISRAIAAQTHRRMGKSSLLKRYHDPVGHQHKSAEDGAQAAMTPADELSSKTPSHRQQQGSHETTRRRYRTDKNKWHLPFWFVYIFIELPASRSALAYTTLKNKEKGELRFSPREIFNVLFGVLVLPWCLVGWITQLIVLNVMDLVHLRRCKCSAYTQSFVTTRQLTVPEICSTNPQRRNHRVMISSMERLAYY
jgi:hypothetical protein